MSKVKFVENVKPDVTTDLVFMMCPMHLLKLDEKMGQLEGEQILELITDYDGAMDDIPEWCEKTGNEFLGMDEEDETYKFYIKKTSFRKFCPVPEPDYEKCKNICKTK